MNLKELIEVKNSVVTEMKNLVDKKENFNLETFNKKEEELKEIENKINSLKKIENLTITEKEGTKDMEFKNCLIEGKELKVNVKNATTTTNLKMEKVANGEHIAEIAKENGILAHVRQIPVNGTSIVPVSYTHLTLPTSAVACRSRWSPYH